MIAAVEGILNERGDNWAIVKVGGISLQVYVPASIWSQLGVVGDRVQLHTHFQLRDDNVALYGFATKAELEIFRMLIGVEGIGPKAGLAILSSLSPEQLTLAIASNDLDTLTRLPGVGKKTAQRLVLELKGRLDNTWGGVETAYLTDDNVEVMAALTNLGYSASEASRAIAALSDSTGVNLEEKIKLALQYLAPTQMVGG
jgi:Holliday junction DNA helicase RuvA